MEDKNKKILIAGASGLGVSLGSKEVGLLDRYLALLKKWSKGMNLTGIHDERDQVVALILDSLAVVPVLNEKMRVMDLGSGAGLPGIPIKVALPGIEMVLVESRQKRAIYLKEAIRKLELSGIVVHHGRSEEMAGSPLPAETSESIKDEVFDAILARAVGKLGEISRMVSGLLAEGGLLIAMKGPDPRAELEDSKEEVEKHGLALEEVRHYELPEGAGKRSLLIFRKAGVV